MKMAAASLGHTSEALAFITLYKTMRPEVKDEVREMIMHECDRVETELYAALSLQTWDIDGEGLAESAIWEKFYNERRHAV